MGLRVGAAALTCCYVLDAEDRSAGLGFRAARLTGRVAELDAQLARVRDRLPGAVLLDDEYRRALWHAEVAWVESLVADLLVGADGANSAVRSQLLRKRPLSTVVYG